MGLSAKHKTQGASGIQYKSATDDKKHFFQKYLNKSFEIMIYIWIPINMKWVGNVKAWYSGRYFHVSVSTTRFMLGNININRAPSSTDGLYTAWGHIAMKDAMFVYPK